MRRTSESLKLVLYQFSDYIFVIDNLNVTSWEKFQVSIKNLSVKKCFITISKDYVLLENDIYILCANVLLTKGVLHLHSSFVLYKDKALVFTGPSGIGKTTQAELWRDFQGALIVNGDACLLRRMEDGWHAFGTPVHGSSPYCENREAPLSALVVLKQGRENRLERLDAFSALSECLPEFYRPRMDPETEDTFWKAADSLFREIPVYKLTCRPDREATELVKETIFGA